MISQALQKARDYEEQYGAHIESEARPAFHLSPKVGWMNDPNGFCEYNGSYHLFYQYHPYSTQWGPMHWGHAVSRDLFHWDYLPAALAPDMPYDQDGCFSGSALELPDGRQLLLYTGVQRRQEQDGSVRDIQTQCVALGDGLNFEKYENNPVLDGKDIPEGFSIYDFRDPKVFRNADGSYGCVVGNRTDDDSGAILLFCSPDGLQWRFASILDRSRNEYGKMWECPDFFALDGSQVIVISPESMCQHGLEFHSGHCTMALIGDYDADHYQFVRRSVQAIDYGLDFYAPQTLQAKDGRRIMIGWMQDWKASAHRPEDAKYFGQMSTPRELTIRNGRLIQNPVRELEALHGCRVAHTDVLIAEETALEGICGRVVDMTVTVKPVRAGGYEMFCMKFAMDSQYETTLSYCPRTSVLRLSRINSGFDRNFVNERECLVRDRGGEIKLRVVLDRFSAEVFVNDGEQALSAVLYTPLTADGIRFTCEGEAVLSVEKYALRV